MTGYCSPGVWTAAASGVPGLTVLLASHYMAGTLSGLDKYSAQLLKFKKDHMDSCQFKLKKDHCNKKTFSESVLVEAGNFYMNLCIAVTLTISPVFIHY